jgi:hypothetical protein
MQRLFMVTYRFRENLDENDLQELTKRFTEIGAAPSTVAHYARLDGRGGFVLREDVEDEETSFEVTLRYAPWMDFEVIPVTTIEDAFPVIQRLYG